MFYLDYCNYKFHSRKDVDFILPEGSRDGVGAFGGVRIVVGAAAATDMS